MAGSAALRTPDMILILRGDRTYTVISDNHLGTPWEPYIIQLNAAEGVEEVPSDPYGEADRSTEGRLEVPSTKVRKVLIDGILYIERNGEMYDVTGKRVSEK